MRIAILGSGAIGGMIALLFEKGGHEVICIDREENLDVLEKKGIRFESKIFGSVTAHPKTAAKLEDPVDLLFVTVKAPFLSEALGRISFEAVSDSKIIPLLNGLEHIEKIRKVLGKKVIVGMIGRVEVILREPGVVFHVTDAVPHVELASKDVLRSEVEKLANLILNIGIDAEVREFEAEVVWRKLARLNAIASLTAAFQQPIGEIRENPELREKLFNAVREGSEVAMCDGVFCDSDAVMKEIDALPAELTTSLQRDIRAGRSSELEAITGAVLRRGRQCGISCPTIEEIYERLRKLIVRNYL